MSLDSAFDQEKSLDRAFDAEGLSAPQGHPNPDARSNPVSPAAEHRSLLQRFVNPPGHGRAGGFIGGVAGSSFGPVGTAVGGAAGNLLGQRTVAGDEAVDPVALEQYRKAGRIPLDYKPSAPPTDAPDYAAAGIDGATQGALGLAMKGLALGAAKLGFPRVAALLGSKTPRQAVLDAAPDAVRGVSTPSLQALDATTYSAGAAAARKQAATEAELESITGRAAMERDRALQAMAPIQQRMPGRVAPLAAKTKEFAGQLEQHVPADKIDKAFADATLVPEAASSQPVMQARQRMIQEAVPQTLDSRAMKMAGRPVAAAAARGAGDAGGHFAQAAGLEALAGKMPPMDNNILKSIFANKVTGGLADMIPSGGMRSRQMAQTAAAVLGSRGSGSVDPMLEKILTNNPAYKAAPLPQGVEELLRRFGAR